MPESENKFIPIKNAVAYLVDRDGLSHVDNVYCYLNRFGVMYDSLPEEDDADENTKGEEVYLIGFFKIDQNYISDYFDSRLLQDTFQPFVTMVDGKVNGKNFNDHERVFSVSIHPEEVYVKQSDLDKVSARYGIFKGKKFDNKYLLTLSQIEAEYDPEDYQIFYPDEEDEFHEYYKNEDDEEDVVNKKPARIVREDHAIRREQVLGAALSSLANWAEKCKNKSDKFEGRKIQELIEEKSLLFWPETGSPPMAGEGIERLINKWIKRFGQD